MDRRTLVESQIEDGQKLLARLVEEEFPFTAAAWLKEYDSGSWYLYIASPLVTEDGGHKGYRRLHEIMRKMPQPFSLDPFAVKLIETTDSITEALHAAERRRPGSRPIQRGEGSLGWLYTDGAYIYPVAAPATS
jgi:hypothetical protein